MSSSSMPSIAPRRLYVPQIGRFLQTDPVPGGSTNAYAYSSADPVNNSDPSGESSAGFPHWLYEMNDQIGQEIVAREAAREAAARREAEEIAEKAAEIAAMDAGEYAWPEGTEDPEWHVANLSGRAAHLLATGLLAGGIVAEEVVGKYLGEYAQIITKLGRKITEQFAGNLNRCANAVSMYTIPTRCEVWLDVTFKYSIYRPMFVTVKACYRWAKKWNCTAQLGG